MGLRGSAAESLISHNPKLQRVSSNADKGLKFIGLKRVRPYEKGFERNTSFKTGA